jgi:hypothetical protein
MATVIGCLELVKQQLINDDTGMILRKPRLDQGADYERGFIDGMMYQTQTTVNKAVDAMSKRTWVGLTNEERLEVAKHNMLSGLDAFAKAIEQALKERNT